MKIKNNRRRLVILQYKVGIKKEIAKIKPSQIIDLPKIKNMSNIVNKVLFNNGCLSVVKDEIVKDEIVKEKEDESKIDKSKIDEAIDLTEDFVKSSKSKKKTTRKSKNK